MWDEYDRWTQALAEVVSPEQSVPGPVYLDLEDDEQQRLGAVLGYDASTIEDRLSEVVALTLGTKPAALFGRHTDRLRTSPAHTEPVEARGRLLPTGCAARLAQLAAPRGSRRRRLSRWLDRAHQFAGSGIGSPWLSPS
jgi:hypothetical protein